LFLFGSIFNTYSQENIDVQDIIDKSISIHGGESVANGSFSFDFRKHHYSYHRDNGNYTYTRQHKETGIKDVLTNDGLKRFDKNEEQAITDKKKRSFSNSVNSVIYFAFLPYFLNDDAVYKKMLGEVEIRGNPYYKVQVTFSEDGGGDDFEDVYVYWINKDSYEMEYLAYSFHVNGGGVRFREAYNSRRIGGVLFQDFVNYKHDKTTPVADLDDHFEKGGLVELSRIVLENVREQK